jgi:AraC family transcriptional regulator of adaptative response / DNA-3-methyladenine glycosylase II
MRLIADGVVDRDGVSGLARRLHFSERHLGRQLVAEVGAGPQSLARAQRAQTARILIETTEMRFSDVAFAAGFSSIRQFNDTIQAVFAESPSRLRAKSKIGKTGTTALLLRLPFRQPFDATTLLRFLGERAVPGVEEFDGTSYRRVLRLPHGTGIGSYEPGEGHVKLVLHLEDLRDLTVAIGRSRRMLDLDADPVAIDNVLGSDPLLKKLVRAHPGRRVPGSADASEIALRAVLGQQVTVAGARTLAGRLVERCGQPLPTPDGNLTHAFPAPADLVSADLDGLGMPGARAETLRSLAKAIDGGEVELDAGADREEVETRLTAIKGIGPWTASYIAMRALKDPDAFPAGDLGLVRALERLGAPSTGASLIQLAERWRPWRAYAVHHLWSSLSENRKTNGRKR